MSLKFIRNRLLYFLNWTNNARNSINYNNSILNLKTVSIQSLRSNQNITEYKCWKCGTERKNFKDVFCEKCNSIQNPHEKDNYFKVFNLDVAYDINQKDLTNSYRKLQSFLHPDKFTNKTDTEKQISSDYSSLVNKAYKTLQTPIDRAIHLLNLNNESISEDNKADNPEFLMEMMELNEEIDEADTDDKIRLLSKKNKNMLDESAINISNHFKMGDVIEAKKEIIKMKYYVSVSKRINDLMREKGIID